MLSYALIDKMIFLRGITMKPNNYLIDKVIFLKIII